MPYLHFLSQQFTLGSTLGVVRSAGFNKYTMTCIYHYNIKQDSFTTVKIPCAPATHPVPQLSATTDLFTISNSRPSCLEALSSF